MPRWLKWTITAIVFVGLTLALYFVGFKGDWIKPMVEQAGWFGYILYIIVQIFMTTLLCFVPATTFTFTLLSVNIFGVITGLILSIIGCWFSSITMFLVGKYGGTKLVDWLVGEEDRIKAQNLISDRATVLVPVMLACPFFPDDAICMVSGMTKMNVWYFSVMSLITRSIGIASTALLGNDATLNYIKTALGDNILLWFMLINLILFDIWVIWKGSGKVEEILRKRRQKRLKKQIIIEEKKDDRKSILKTDKIYRLIK